MKSKLHRRFALAAVLLAVGLAQNASAQSLKLTDLTDLSRVESGYQIFSVSEASQSEESDTPILTDSRDWLVADAADAEVVDPQLADPSVLTPPSGEVMTEDSATTEAANSNAGAQSVPRRQRRPLGLGEWWRVAPQRQIAIGLNGAAGDTETLDLVSGFDSKRMWGRHSVFTDLDYFYSRANVATTKNRLYSLTRYERAIVGTPYSWFADSWFEYDQFRPYDVRIAFHAGLIRTFIKTDRQTFRMLAGMGAAKTYGGAGESDLKAEPEFGALYELQINSRQKLYASALYYPELTDPSLFRLNIKGGWEVKVSDTRDIAIRLWFYNRYDNTELTIVSPNINPNALDYAASLVYGF